MKNNNVGVFPRRERGSSRPQSITIKAYAKLNLFLDILGKRPDGYHEILTKMCTIDLSNEVTITIGETGIISENNKNAYKAADLFLNKINSKENVKLNINKNIPEQAGLGSSSADSAAVLRGLNTFYGAPFTLDEIMNIGAEVGSDVPFCIHGGCAVCSGTGIEISEILPLPDCVFVIVKPEFSFSTKDAYARFIGRADPAPATQFYNIFEELHNHPEIDKIKQELIAQGASAALMTGSGSAVFGVFENPQNAEKALKNLNFGEKFIAKPLKF